MPAHRRLDRRRSDLYAGALRKRASQQHYRDNKGQIATVRYEQINAMFLNEFLKEHKKVEDLEGIVTSLAATVKEQTAQIQKVSAQLEASKPALQVVNNS
jgi:hypothetical protein